MIPMSETLRPKGSEIYTIERWDAWQTARRPLVHFVLSRHTHVVKNLTRKILTIKGVARESRKLAEERRQRQSETKERKIIYVNKIFYTGYIYRTL